MASIRNFSPGTCKSSAGGETATDRCWVEDLGRDGSKVEETANPSIWYVGLSENSVPLNPMVNDHYPVFKWLFHWDTLFSDKPMW